MGWFLAQCEVGGMKVPSCLILWFSKRVDCPLCIKNELQAQVKQFEYLVLLFTSEGRVEKKTTWETAIVSAVMWMLHQFVVVKGELSVKGKLSIYGHKLFVVAERMRIWIPGYRWWKWALIIGGWWSHSEIGWWAWSFWVWLLHIKGTSWGWSPASW